MASSSAGESGMVVRRRRRSAHNLAIARGWCRLIAREGVAERQPGSGRTLEQCRNQPGEG